MKNIVLLILGVVAWLCSCKPQNGPSTPSYYVPDNFPKDTFFSYLPYTKGQEVRFYNGVDTLKLKAEENVFNFYDRATTDCKITSWQDCIKEEIISGVRLVNDTMNLCIRLVCTERTYFDVWIENYYPDINHLTVFDQYKYEQKKLSDEIFEQFAEEIVLFGRSKVKQHVGLVCFVDKAGQKWELAN